jgi:hypothetical protein
VEVRHDEGVAIRIDPEPCADARKGGSEASVGERIGQQLSLAKTHILGADAVAEAEGNMDGRVSASSDLCRGALRNEHRDPHLRSHRRRSRICLCNRSLL